MNTTPNLIGMLRGMFWTNVKGHVAIWYPDGDFCAEIQDNLGLGIYAQDVAIFICAAAEQAQPAKGRQENPKE